MFLNKTTSLPQTKVTRYGAKAATVGTIGTWGDWAIAAFEPAGASPIVCHFLCVLIGAILPHFLGVIIPYQHCTRRNVHSTWFPAETLSNARSHEPDIYSMRSLYELDIFFWSRSTSKWTTRFTELIIFVFKEKWHTTNSSSAIPPLYPTDEFCPFQPI